MDTNYISGYFRPCETYGGMSRAHTHTHTVTFLCDSGITDSCVKQKSNHEWNHANINTLICAVDDD